MKRLPSLPARKIIAALEKAGFVIVRIKGTHHFLRHRSDPTRTTVVSYHARDLPPGTLRAILKQAGLTPEEFIDLL